MFVEKLEVFGFKSFLDRLALEFGPGITGVVGPNGCGKSNVADAIRWVLGEQNSRTLRGEKMEDVIFSGTRDVKALAMAEVEMTVSNDRGLLPVEYSNVKIGRRLFRSGLSEYTLNGAPCRLKDIRDLFLDTGMGSHAYSVIERDMVDRVLSDQSGHRRFLFEEAAGIMKYKTRKKEALGKLEATMADLIRLGDILVEVEREVELLGRQVGKARRHRKLTEEIEALDLAVSRGQWSGFAREAAGLSETHGKAAGEREALRTRLSVEEAALEDLRARALEKEAEYREAREALASVDQEINTLNNEILVLRERIAGTQLRSEQGEEEIRRIEGRLEGLAAELDAVANDRAARRDEGLALARELAKAEEEHGVRTAALAEAREELERKKQAARDLFEERVRGSGELERLAGERETLEAARSRRASEMAALGVERESLERSLAELEGRREAAETQAREAGSRRAEAARARETLAAAVARAREEVAARRAEEAAWESRLTALRDLRERYEGYDRGVRALLLDPSRDPGILGTVGDLLTVPREWAEALDTVLSRHWQTIVVDRQETALRLLNRLRKERAGSATFLALSEIPAEEGPTPAERIETREGVIAAAHTLVSVEDRFRPVVRYLLGDTLLLEGLYAAVAFLEGPAAGRLRLLTKDGILITGRALLSGGVGGEHGEDLLARDRELAETEEALATARSRAREAAETLSRLETEEERAEKEAKDSEARLESAQEAVRSLDRERAEWDLRLERVRATLAEVSKRETEDVERLARLDAEALEATAALAGMVRSSDEAEQAHLAFEARVRSSAAAWEESVTRLNELRVREATARNSAQEMELREARYRSEAGELRESRDRRREEIAAAAETLVLLEGEVTTRADGIEGRRSTREERQERVRGLERIHAERLTESHAREDEVRGLRRRAEEEGESAHRAELRLTEIHGEMARIRARIADEYGMEIGARTDLEPPADLDGALARLLELRERRKSIGPVNALAVEEYESKSERLRFLTAQRDDLLKAKASLDETIRHINSTAADLFTKTCEIVAANFKETFSVLFQGGEAELQFVGDDPLEADIEIIARPRGKRPQSIQLLSGGERALTAIALLFAIYLVKPSPFCILDEVDAPLDDANIDRFVNMLRTFSERTQFIVITHNKKTMEIADRLYGVTMRIPGVSQVVSVRLNGKREIESVARDAEVSERRPEAEVGGRV